MQKAEMLNPFFDKQCTRIGTSANFQQKILNTTVVGTRQEFQFFRQITWFLRNNRALSKFRYRILLYLIRMIKL